MGEQAAMARRLSGGGITAVYQPDPSRVRARIRTWPQGIAWTGGMALPGMRRHHQCTDYPENRMHPIRLWRR
ncbi:MAG: hypothetical protein OXC07_04130 [Kistimonas sp.]|nr:hypothetical protein [Kistimonas sp.]